MPEKKLEMRQIGIMYLCDTCGSQVQFAGDRVWPNDPETNEPIKEGEPLYLNKCTNEKCAKAYAQDQPYPRTMLVPKEEDRLVISPFAGRG